MKYSLCLVFFTCSFFYSQAQYNVVFKLGKYPDKYNNDTAFLAGNFNNWNPANSDFRFLLTNENSFELILNFVDIMQDNTDEKVLDTILAVLDFKIFADIKVKLPSYSVRGTCFTLK